MKKELEEIKAHVAGLRLRLPAYTLPKLGQFWGGQPAVEAGGSSPPGPAEEMPPARDDLPHGHLLSEQTVAVVGGSPVRYRRSRQHAIKTQRGLILIGIQLVCLEQRLGVFRGHPISG